MASALESCFKHDSFDAMPVGLKTDESATLLASYKPTSQLHQAGYGCWPD